MSNLYASLGETDLSMLWSDDYGTELFTQDERDPAVSHPHSQPGKYQGSFSHSLISSVHVRHVPQDCGSLPSMLAGMTRSARDINNNTSP